MTVAPARKQDLGHHAFVATPSRCTQPRPVGGPARSRPIRRGRSRVRCSCVRLGPEILRVEVGNDGTADGELWLPVEADRH